MSQSQAGALAPPEPRADGKHVLLILDRLHGDKEVPFDPKDKKDIEKASKEFEGAKRDKKMRGIGVERDGEASTVDNLDPKKPKTVMVSPISGG